MQRIGSQIGIPREELAAEADAASKLSERLALLATGGTFSESSLRDVPTFDRTLYVPKTIFVCMGQFRTSGEGRSEMIRTEEIVVDGSGSGWVLTRRGLFGIDKHLGMFG